MATVIKNNNVLNEKYMKITKKMQMCRLIYYSLAALRVSSDIFAHHQEHLNCITAFGITHYVAAGWYRGSVVSALP